MATITLPNTFTAGTTIVSADVNSNFSTIYNDYNGNITNANISASAAISDTKLDLASIAQDVTHNGNFLVGATNQGDILYDNGTTFTRLTPGTSGQVLETQGAGANPIWANADIANLEIASEAQGDILYYNGSSWTRLAAGTNGHFLETQGAGANPQWTANATVLGDAGFRVRLTGVLGTTWDETDGFDIGGDFASNTFTAPTTGKYLMFTSIQAASTTTDSRLSLQFGTSGTAQDFLHIGTCSTSGIDWAASCTAIFQLTASDTVTLTVTPTNATTTTSAMNRSYWGCMQLT
jgi:hypothetical protein